MFRYDFLVAHGTGTCATLLTLHTLPVPHYGSTSTGAPQARQGFEGNTVAKARERHRKHVKERKIRQKQRRPRPTRFLIFFPLHLMKKVIKVKVSIRTSLPTSRPLISSIVDQKRMTEAVDEKEDLLP